VPHLFSFGSSLPPDVVLLSLDNDEGCPILCGERGCGFCARSKGWTCDAVEVLSVLISRDFEEKKISREPCMIPSGMVVIRQLPANQERKRRTLSKC